jgi:hypothetical protein
LIFDPNGKIKVSAVKYCFGEVRLSPITKSSAPAEPVRSGGLQVRDFDFPIRLNFGFEAEDRIGSLV